MTQEIIAAKSAKLQSAVAELVGIVAEAVDQKIAAQVVERSVLKKALAVGQMTRELLFDHLGVGDEVKARNPDGAKPVICIRDGQQDLWTEIDVFQPASERVEILDLLHVTPRLWKAARLFSSGQTAAASFVRSRLLNLLRGEVADVIRGLKRMAALRNLSGPQRKTIAVICAYLSKNRHRLRYHEYLAKGDPIASGVIEGACRHVVKDRLERTGMNWTVPGASVGFHHRRAA